MIGRVLLDNNPFLSYLVETIKLELKQKRVNTLSVYTLIFHLSASAT